MSRDRGNNLNGAEGSGGAGVEPAGRWLALALRGNFGVCTAGKGKKNKPHSPSGNHGGCWRGSPVPGALPAWTALGFGHAYGRKWGCRGANEVNPKRGRSLVKEKETGAGTKTPSLNGEGRFEPMHSLEPGGCRAGATSKTAPGCLGGAHLGTPTPAWHPPGRAGCPRPHRAGIRTPLFPASPTAASKSPAKRDGGVGEGGRTPSISMDKAKKKSPEDGRKKVRMDAGSPAGGETLGAVRAAMGRGLGGGLGARNAAEVPTHPSVLPQGRAATRRL